MCVGGVCLSVGGRQARQKCRFFMMSRARSRSRARARPASHCHYSAGRYFSAVENLVVFYSSTFYSFTSTLELAGGSCPYILVGRGRPGRKICDDKFFWRVAQFSVAESVVEPASSRRNSCGRALSCP